MAFDLAWIAQQFPDHSSIALLAEGGQKFTYSAVNSSGAQVALKLIKPGQDPERVSREISSARRFSSGHVPSILNTGLIPHSVGSLVWIEEFFVTGETLRKLLERRSTTVSEIIRYGLQVLEVLAEAEGLGVVHRDIKPENIMIDNNNDAWVLDFGIARVLTDLSITPTANAFGLFTPGYAPREQFANDKGHIDGRADLFGFGVLMYESLTGSNPFAAGATSPQEMLARVDSLALQPLVLSGPRGNALSSFVAALTQKKRIHRPLSVSNAYEWLAAIAPLSD